jgi:glycosyltransferase involved in cell wall biosynthesis
LTNASIGQNQLNNVTLNIPSGISTNNSMANNINSNNLSLTNNNAVSNSNNLALANNNSTNVSQNLRNMKELDSNILKDFYALCDQKKLNTVKKNKKQSSDRPFISIIIPFYNNKLNLIKTLRSLQLQTLKNIEIIIVDDNNAKVNKEYKNLLDSDYRLRLFSQPKNMGLWRKRIDGFLYSRGKYILHINPGDILADSYVLEDLYHLVSKYNLDTVRFSFSKTKHDRSTLKENIKFNEKKIYPSTFTKIIYGKPNYNVHIFGYGTIWNRLVRAGVMRKGLDLLDKELLNVYKDLWEDMWWNDLIDRVSFSNLVVNRLGYIFLYDKRYSIEPRIGNKFLKNKSIKEFILFWYWDYCLLPRKNNKKSIVDTLRKYIKPDNKFSLINMSLEFLTDRYRPYENLLKRLINDPFVEPGDKKFVSHLYNTTKAKHSKGSKKT